MNKASFVLACTLALTATGCANQQPSTADLMREQAAQGSSTASLQKSLAKQWDQGNDLITSGTKRIQKAEKAVRESEKELREAQQDLKRAKRDVTKGERMKKKAEKRFAEAFPQTRL